MRKLVLMLLLTFASPPAAVALTAKSPDDCGIIAAMVFDGHVVQRYVSPAVLPRVLRDLYYIPLGAEAYRTAYPAAVARFVAKPEFAKTEPLALMTVIGDACMRLQGDLTAVFK